MLHGVGAVVSLRSQPGISRLEGRVVTGRLFNGFKRKDAFGSIGPALVTRTSTSFPLNCLCAAQASLYQHSSFSLGFFVGRQGSLLAFTVGELDAFDALLALLSICSGRRFLTSQPYSPLGWGHSLVVSSFALFTVSDFFWGGGIFLE